MMMLQAAVIACALGAAPSPCETVLLDFTASWCAPCRQMEPIVAQLAAQGYPVRKVDIDQEAALAAQYRVTGVPCFVLVANGQEAGRVVGAANYESLVGLFQQANTKGGAVAMPGALDLPAYTAPA